MSREVTIVIDGREVAATEGEMLHDAAKRGDVEIPVFCYEPKLGEPVGACRMCLVEIEGIPKVQTACSTAVKDGMVVHTQTQRVHDAQRAVVEFLLINHPLDCPVCDKGGECPLQDQTLSHGTKVRELRAPSHELRVTALNNQEILPRSVGLAGWPQRVCSKLTARSYFAEFDAIFFTMASTSLRSLSFRLVE